MVSDVYTGYVMIYVLLGAEFWFRQHVYRSVGSTCVICCVILFIDIELGVVTVTVTVTVGMTTTQSRPVCRMWGLQDPLLANY